MENKCFAKSDYYSECALISLYAVIIFLSAVVVYRFPKSVFAVLIILLLFGFLTVVLIKRLKSCGLYIREDKIYYKSAAGFKRRSIDPTEIKGIKIVRAEMPHVRPYGLNRYIKHRGEYRYSMILTNEINEYMLFANYSDLLFCKRFKKHIICCITYNEDIIKMLILLNPDIEIIKHRCTGIIKPKGEKILGRK